MACIFLIFLALSQTFLTETYALNFNITNTLNHEPLAMLLNNNSLTYKLKNNVSLISTPANNSHTGEIKDLHIALIKPIFTNAAYNNKFYKFFIKYANASSTANITTDLDLLNSKITNYQLGTVNNVYAMLDLIKSIRWIDNDTTVDLLSDLDVDKGRIFNGNNNNIHDVIVLGHQEYVTQKEYDNLKKFVSNGGTMIILDGNVFYTEVRYFDNNNTISLVKGHGWAFNGKSAWKSVNERWENETKEWVGSNYFCYQCIKKFKDNPFNYISHEEQYLTNPKDIILLNYNPLEIQGINQKNVTIATYELKYGKGSVIALGIYSDDIIRNGKFDRFFDNLLIRYGLHNDTT